MTLTLELVPASMWWKNVRGCVAIDTWDALRWSFGCTKDKPIFMRLKNLPIPDWREAIKCRVCGAEREILELHEQWQYEDKQRVQRLIGLIPICEDCHLAMHLGRANQLGLAEKATAHLIEVNQWSKKKAKLHTDAAFSKWLERSKSQYSLDLSWLSQFIPESKVHPEWLEHPKRWAGDRLDAIAWAKAMLASKAVIIDTETTGLLDYKRVEVIELAVISMRGRVLYHSRFRPRHKIPQATIEIHGITNEAVKDEQRFTDRHSEVHAALNGKIAVAYNAKFDNGVLSRTCLSNDLQTPDCKWECAMHAYRAFLKAPRWVPLPGGKHTALDDCRATLRLLKLMAKG